MAKSKFNWKIGLIIGVVVFGVLFVVVPMLKGALGGDNGLIGNLPIGGDQW